MSPITVTISVGTETRTMSQYGLAVLLGLPHRHVEERMKWLLDLGENPEEIESTSPQSIHTEVAHEEGGKGGKVNVSVLTQNKNISGYVTSEGGGLEEGTHDGGSEALVDEIASTLRDAHSVPYIRQLVAHHPRALLIAALTLTMRVPPERISTRRAAYFVGVVRRLSTKQLSFTNPSPHARTPSSTP